MFREKIYFKANRLVYTVQKWYGNGIYADCQQKLFSSEYDTGLKISLVTFLAEQKREYDAQS